MRLIPKKLTDDEFVEQQRKILRNFKWMGGILGPILIVCLIGIIIMSSRLLIILYRLNNEVHPNLIYYYGIGIFCGIIYGIILFILFFKGIVFLQRRFGNRMEKLIIKYIDEAGRSGVKNEKDIAYSQFISKAIEKSRGIRWLWIVGAIIVFLLIFPYSYFSILILDKANVSFTLFTSGFLNTAYLLVGRLLAVIMPLLFLPRIIKEESMLIKYYDILKEKSEAISSGNEFKNESDNQVTAN